MHRRLAVDVLTLCFAIALVVSFLTMPWLTATGINILFTPSFRLTALLLIPAAAALALLACFWALLNPRASRAMSFLSLLAGMAGLAYFVILIIHNRSDPFALLRAAGLGLWTALAASIGLVFQVAMIRPMTTYNARRFRTSNLLWIPISILILAVLIYNLLIFVARSLDQPPAVRPGEVIYAYGFDRADYTGQWQTFTVPLEAKIEDGQLVFISNATNDGAFSYLSRELTDFDMQVDLRWLESASQYDQIAIIFRSQDPANYYALRLEGTGAYRVELLKDNVQDVISEWHISPAVATAIGALNQVRITAKGGQIAFTVNSQPLLLCLKNAGEKSTWASRTDNTCLSGQKTLVSEFTDTTFSAGRIALGAFSKAPGLKVAFDNVLILGPQ